MTSHNVILGIDVGTQSTKVVAYDADERALLAVAAAPHDIIQAPDGTSEQDAAWWLEALARCLEALPAEVRREVRAIGVSGQQHGLVPVAADGTVLHNVKLWNDTATAAECADITAALGGRDDVIAAAGNPILPGYTAPKVLWLKRHRPAAYRELARILLPHDYINHHLTGRFAMEHGDASGTGFLDIRTRTWAVDVLRAIDPERDLTACLPPFVEPHRPVGTVRPDIAAGYDLPEGVLVSAGGGDNMMAAVGTGCVSEGVFTASLGTSGTLFGYAGRPVIDKEGTLAAFSSSTGGWLPLVCTMNCTVATELTRTLLDVPVADIDGLAGAVPAGSDGLITVPFYTGERTPNLPNATGTLFGMTPRNVTKAHLLRSAMEAALFGLRYGLDAFRRQGLSPARIHLVGGGARSAVWRRMAADIFGCPVAVHEVDEAAAFGAALQALWMMQRRDDAARTVESVFADHGRMAGDEVPPEPENTAAYTTVYKNYLEGVALLTPRFTESG